MSWLISILYMLEIVLGATVFSIVYVSITYWLEERFGIPLIFSLMGSILIIAIILGTYGIHLKYFGA